MKAAREQLRLQSVSFGTNLTMLQNRERFMKEFSGTLTTGSESVVAADLNEEGAKLLALQVRQQFSSNAMSFATEAETRVCFACSAAEREDGGVALKVELEARERIIIGESVITNDNQRTRPLHRGKCSDPSREGHPHSPNCRHPCQKDLSSRSMMYLAREVNKFQDDYFSLVKEILEAAPSSVPYITRISNHILSGSLYKALREARGLIEYERKLIDHVQSGSSGLSADPADDANRVSWKHPC